MAAVFTRKKVLMFYDTSHAAKGILGAVTWLCRAGGKRPEKASCRRRSESVKKRSEFASSPGKPVYSKLYATVLISHHKAIILAILPCHRTLEWWRHTSAVGGARVRPGAVRKTCCVCHTKIYLHQLRFWRDRPPYICNGPPRCSSTPGKGGVQPHVV